MLSLKQQKKIWFFSKTDRFGYHCSSHSYTRPWWMNHSIYFTKMYTKQCCLLNEWLSALDMRVAYDFTVFIYIRVMQKKMNGPFISIQSRRRNQDSMEFEQIRRKKRIYSKFDTKEMNETSRKKNVIKRKYFMQFPLEWLKSIFILKWQIDKSRHFSVNLKTEL